MSIKIILNGSSEPKSIKVCQEAIARLSGSYDCYINHTETIIAVNDESGLAYQQIIYEFKRK